MVRGHQATPTNSHPSRDSREHRKQWRTEVSFGVARSNYNYKALSAYTFARTERGPQKSWLHKIGKAPGTTCHCGHAVQTGHHLTFHCPTWDNIRTSLIGQHKDWGDLDHPIYIKTGLEKDDVIEGGEEWFTTPFSLMGAR